MNVIKLLIIGFLFTVNFAYSVEKDKLVAFIKEYEASEVKYSGHVAYAIEKGYPDVAEFFLLKGEDVRNYTETSPNLSNSGEYKFFKHPLIDAIRKGYNEAAILMIQLGYWKQAEEYKIEYVRKDWPNNTFYIQMTETDRKNVMFVAIEENSYEIVVSLIDNGFDVDNTKVLVEKVKKSEPFFVDKSIGIILPLFQAIVTKKFNIATLLLERGADVGKVSLFSRSSLLQAVDDNYLEGVILLLSYGANPLKGSPSPLEIAIQKGYLDIVDVLLNAVLSDQHK